MRLSRVMCTQLKCLLAITDLRDKKEMTLKLLNLPCTAFEWLWSLQNQQPKNLQILHYLFDYLREDPYHGSLSCSWRAMDNDLWNWWRSTSIMSFLTWFLLAKKITVTQQLLTNIIGLPEIIFIYMHGNKNNNNNRNSLFALHINTRTIKEEI